MSFLWIIGGIIAVVVLVIFMGKIDDQRRDALKEIAAGLNFVFSDKIDESQLKEWQRMGLFATRYVRGCKNVMGGPYYDLNITLFDLRYSGVNRSVTLEESVLVIQKPGINLECIQTGSGEYIDSEQAEDTFIFYRGIISPEKIERWIDEKIEVLSEVLDRF